MSNYFEAGAVVALALLGCLGLAKALSNVAATSAVIEENEDNVGYYLASPEGRKRRGLERELPTCPDTIPDWMMEEHYGRS